MLLIHFMERPHLTVRFQMLFLCLHEFLLERVVFEISKRLWSCRKPPLVDPLKLARSRESTFESGGNLSISKPLKSVILYHRLGAYVTRGPFFGIRVTPDW